MENDPKDISQKQIYNGCHVYEVMFTPVNIRDAWWDPILP